MASLVALPSEIEPDRFDPHTVLLLRRRLGQPEDLLLDLAELELLRIGRDKLVELVPADDFEFVRADEVAQLRLGLLLIRKTLVEPPRVLHAPGDV